MSEVVLDRALTETEWEALSDPDGGRYEILDGQLVMTPSGDADHSRVGEDLAHILRAAVKRAGLDLPVTGDVEWRTIAADVIVEAPRGDVVVGTRLDPNKRIHDGTPLLVAEIWSVRTRPSTRNLRRSYWAARGVRHYWEVCLGTRPDEAQLIVHDFEADPTEVQSGRGEDELAIDEPFPVRIAPGRIHGWAERESERARRETDAAHERVRQLEQQLRDLGVDPTD